MDRINTRVCCGLACAVGMTFLIEPLFGTLVAGIAAAFGFLFGFLGTR